MTKEMFQRPKHPAFFYFYKGAFCIGPEGPVAERADKTALYDADDLTSAEGTAGFLSSLFLTRRASLPVSSLCLC